MTVVTWVRPPLTTQVIFYATVAKVMKRVSLISVKTSSGTFASIGQSKEVNQSIIVSLALALFNMAR
jgi:hypothetical protein